MQGLVMHGVGLTAVLPVTVLEALPCTVSVCNSCLNSVCFRLYARNFNRLMKGELVRHNHGRGDMRCWSGRGDVLGTSRDWMFEDFVLRHILFKKILWTVVIENCCLRYS